MKPGYKTTEFWFALAAKIVGALMVSGLLGNGTTAARAVGVAAIVLASMGYSISRGIAKSGQPPIGEPIAGQLLETKTSATLEVIKTPQSGFAALGTLLAIVVGTLILFNIAACAWLSSTSKQVGKDVVDCTTKNAVSRISEFGPAIDAILVTATAGDGTVDKDRVKSAISGFATDDARCVLADAVARALSPKPADPTAPQASPLTADPLALRQVFGELGGGKTYHTPHGTL